MRANDALRWAWPRRIDLRRIFTADLPLKLTAVLIALLFWLALSQSAAPRDLTIAFDGRVAIQKPDVPSGFVLRGTLGDVAVKLSGPAGVVDHIGVGDLRATLDLTGVDAGTDPRDARVNVTVSTPQVKVVDISPATVSIRLERITSRTVAVQARFANEPPAGLQAGKTSVAPTEVTVKGPESAVAQVAGVFATVRFGDTPNDISQSVPVTAVDAGGLTVDAVEVDPSAVVVRVPLLPIATTKTVPILWNLRGTVAPGYWISQVTTDPVAVTISGDQSVLGKVARLDTTPIDVSGADATRTVHAALVLPDGVSLLQQVTVDVTVSVSPLAGTRPFLVAVIIENVDAQLLAQTDPPSITVVLAGPAPTLERLTAGQVTAMVDAAGRTAGTYTVDVTVTAPAGTTVQSLQPGRVTLTLKSKT